MANLVLLPSVTKDTDSKHIDFTQNTISFTKLNLLNGIIGILGDKLIWLNALWPTS